VFKFFINPAREDNIQIVSIRQEDINFRGEPKKIILISDVTEVVNFRETESVHTFFELLTATVSHEMLTPLNSVLSLLALLLDKVKDQNVNWMLRIVNSSAYQLRYLVTDMVDLFQIKNKQFKLNEHPVLFVSDIKAFGNVIKEPCLLKLLDFELIFSGDLQDDHLFLVLDI
jgi:signal transduction histidine kinase